MKVTKYVKSQVSPLLHQTQVHWLYKNNQLIIHYHSYFHATSLRPINIESWEVSNVQKLQKHLKNSWFRNCRWGKHGCVTWPCQTTRPMSEDTANPCYPQFLCMAQQLWVNTTRISWHVPILLASDVLYEEPSFLPDPWSFSLQLGSFLSYFLKTSKEYKNA